MTSFICLLQELIEKETTQSEVLHMECKETGQFAHRETTQYEQLETFNAEVVAETKGAEEYVHLKSLEDEYHYMESTMPNKDGQDGQTPPREEGQGHPGQQHGEMHGQPMSAEDAAAQAAMEEEYAEAYRLYHQKEQERRDRGDPVEDEDDTMREMFSISPRQQPQEDQAQPLPPFSNDSNMAQGFSANNSTAREDADRARDAFAFAEALDDDQAGGGGGGQQEDLEESQLFGEKIESSPAAAASSRRGSGLQGKAYLFEPGVDPEDKPLAVGAEDVQPTATMTIDVPEPVAPTDNYFSRTSSYESLHEID